MQLKSLLQDGVDGSLSSRRVVTFLAFVFCSIAFFANLFYDKKIDPVIFEGMMYIAIAGLGATVAEKFSTRNTNKQQYVYETRRPIYGTPIPRMEPTMGEKEI